MQNLRHFKTSELVENAVPMDTDKGIYFEVVLLSLMGSVTIGDEKKINNKMQGHSHKWIMLCIDIYYSLEDY